MYKIKVWWHDGKYWGRIGVRKKAILKKSVCAFKLLLLLYCLIMTGAPHFQNTPQLEVDEVFLSHAIKFPIIRTIESNRVGTKLVKFKSHSAVKKIIRDVEKDLPAELLEGIDGYVHSSTVTDQALIMKGLGILGAREPKGYDFEVGWIQFVRTSLHAPHRGGKLLRVSCDGLSNQAQASVPLEKTSTGQLGVVALTDKKLDKRNTQHISLYVNTRDENLRRPPPQMIHLGFQKSEVIKKGKPVRFIQVSAAPNVIIDTLCASWESVPRLAEGGVIGISTTTGRLKKALLVWFAVYRSFTGECYSGFLDWLGEQVMDEADKKSWESSTNVQDGLNHLQGDVLHEPLLSKNKSKLRQRAQADYINPCIAVGTREAFHATYRVASGTYRTGSGNTKRHCRMNIFFCDFVELHEFATGKVGCECSICSDEKVQSHPGFGKKYDKMLLALRRHAWIQGDDYLAVGCCSEFYAFFVDHVFGTETVTSKKKFFGQPSLLESGSAEFLRQTFVRKNDDVYTAKNPTRVLAKLFKGESTKTRERWAAALLSARHEVGYNPELQDLLFKMSAVVDCEQVVEFEKEVKRMERKHHELAGQSAFMLHSWKDIVNRQLQIEQDMAEVLDVISSWRAQKV